jgi:hypothetical protein
MATYRFEFPGVQALGEAYQFGVMTQGSADDALAAAAADAAQTALLTDASDVWRPDVTFAPPKVTQVGATAGFPAISQALGTASGAGTGSGSNCPPQIAICVSLRTALVGRAFRGRFYLPTPTVGQLTEEGRLGGAALEALGLGLTGFFDALVGGGYVPVIGHRSTGSNTHVVSADIGDLVDTQRRRRNASAELRSPVWSL